MLYLKTANFEDLEKEYLFVTSEPADENGFINDFVWSDGENAPLKQKNGGIIHHKDESGYFVRIKLR